MDDDPPYDISVSLEAKVPAEAQDCVCNAVEATLARYGTRVARVSIAVVDDEAIQVIHAKHLDRDEPTDVLAFDMRNEASEPKQGPPHALVDGDIVVSVDTAQREADRRGHDLLAELALYVVHGTLHLLGHDDHATEDAAKMHEIENEILTSLGHGAVYGAPR